MSTAGSFNSGGLSATLCGDRRVLGERCSTCSGASDTVCADPWQSVLEGLVQKNHVTQLLRSPDSVVQVVVRQGERLCAESDPRKGGYPAGY